MSNRLMIITVKYQCLYKVSFILEIIFFLYEKVHVSFQDQRKYFDSKGLAFETIIV